MASRLVGLRGVEFGSAQIGADPHEYLVNLTGVTNAQRLTVTLNGVTDTQGFQTPLLAITAGFLLGDTTGNGSVTASDIGQAKGQSGQPVSAANFRNDVNANGAITASDIGQVKAQSGTQLP